MKLWYDESWLRARYLGDNLSIRQVASLAGCSHVMVLRQMKKFGITARDMGDAIRLHHGNIDLYRDGGWLQEQISSGSSCGQIAVRCNVGKETISKWCKKYGIYRRVEGSMWKYGRFIRNEWVCDCGCNVANEVGEEAYSDYGEGMLPSHIMFICPCCGIQLEFEVKWSSPAVESVRLIDTAFPI